MNTRKNTVYTITKIKYKNKVDIRFNSKTRSDKPRDKKFNIRKHLPRKA